MGDIREIHRSINQEVLYLLEIKSYMQYDIDIKLILFLVFWFCFFDLAKN